MIKTCERCGGTFDLHGLAKYCVPCRREIKNEYNRRYQRMKACLRYERVRRCAVCGKEFEARTCAKYCPDCRKEAYRNKSLECQRILRATGRGKKRVTKPVDPQKKRLAYLRKRLSEAQTHEERRRYFHQYVLLKQELSRKG